MGRRSPGFKHILASALAAVWISAPATAQDAPDLREADPREADLLRQLAEAEDVQAAARVESALAALWSQSGSAAVDLLLRRGADALEAGSPEAAIEHLTAAIDHAPAFAEAYAARAAALYLTNRVGPALDDLRQALVLNPRHMGAMAGFAVLLEEMGREEDALEVWRGVAAMDPQDEDAQASVGRLGLLLDGLTL